MVEVKQRKKHLSAYDLMSVCIVTVVYLYLSSYNLMSVCMFMTVVPGMQISSGVVPSIST